MDKYQWTKAWGLIAAHTAFCTVLCVWVGGYWIALGVAAVSGYATHQAYNAYKKGM